MRGPFWRPMLLLVALGLTGCHGGSDKAGGKPAPKVTVLSLAAPFGDPTEVTGFVDEVSRLSHGTIRIVVRDRWRWGQVAYENGLIRDVRVGKTDLGVAGSRAWDSVGVTSLRALGAPLLIDSYALQDRVVRSPLISEMLMGLRRLGLVGLGVLPGPLRRPLGAHRPLLGPSDYEGLRIGVQQSRVASATMRALGAAPVWIAAGRALTGLGGVETFASAIEGIGQDEPGSYLTSNVVLWVRPIVLFANGRVFAKLTPYQRRILERAVTDDVTPETNLLVNYERSDTSTLCARGRLRFAAASRADLAALRRAVRPVYAQLERDPLTRRVISYIQTTRDHLGVSPSLVPSCRARSTFTAPTEATAADGVYALTVAPRDLAAAERIPEAYGSWQIVLDRGRFWFSQRSADADWVADGRVRVAGHEMSWTVADALDVGPHGVPDGLPLRRGQTLRFWWSRSSRGLELTAKGAKTAPPALSVRPLTSVAVALDQQPLENPATLQGTWVANPTAADVTAHHDDPLGIAANTGPMRLTVHGAHYRWTRHAPNGDHWAVGICRFAGDTLELEQTATDSSSARAPYFWHWSVFHDRLTFRQAPGFSPEGWTYHPWRKVA